MSAGFEVDGGVLLAGFLLLAGVLASRIAAKVRVPSLLMFLALGMLVADDGLQIIRFGDTQLAQNIAAVALIVILFEGGLGTDPEAFHTVGGRATLLATFGVVITALVVGVMTTWLLGWPLESALLLGSVMASTDAAAVFTALRTETLPQQAGDTVKLESAMNDPIAVLLTVGMIELWRSDPAPWDWAWFLTRQLGGGALVGILVGIAGRRLIQRIRGAAVSSLGMVSLAVAAISYGTAAVVGASGFLAVYLTGTVLARARHRVRGVLLFQESLAATAQGVLFLMLGLLVFPSRLVNDLGGGIVVALALIFVARPIAVVSILSWFKVAPRTMAVIIWAGLRGAVPIVLATIPRTAGHPNGQAIFDITFVVVVFSVLVQAPLVGPLARRLGVISHDQPTGVSAQIVPVDAPDANLAEVEIGPASALVGSTLAAAPPPGGALVAIIRRGAATIVPKGDTVIESRDVLLVVATDQENLDQLDAWVVGTI